MGVYLSMLTAFLLGIAELSLLSLSSADRWILRSGVLIWRSIEREPCDLSCLDKSERGGEDGS
jgi:hypothetical protein